MVGGGLGRAWGSFALNGPIERCPVCGSDRVFPVSGFDDKYRCDGCARCWSVGMHGAKRVDPVRCPGCRDRAACFDRLRVELPAWGPLVLD